MNRTYVVRTLLPAFSVTLGLVVLTVLWHLSAPSSRQRDTAADTSATPASQQSSTSQPHVTVNGQPVEVGLDGEATVSSPSGETKLESSGGHTTVTTTTPGTSQTHTVSGDGDLSVSVNSNTTSGSSWSSTQVSGFSAGASAGSSYSSTSVFSSGPGDIHVNQ